MSKIPVNCRFCELPLKACRHLSYVDHEIERRKTMTKELHVIERTNSAGVQKYWASSARVNALRPDERQLGVYVPKKSQLEPLPPSPRVAELELELTQLKEAKVREIADLRQASGTAMKEIRDLRELLKRAEEKYEQASRNHFDWKQIAQKLADALAKEES